MTTQQGVRRDYERPRGQRTLAWVVAALVVAGGIVAFLYFVIEPNGGGSQATRQVTTLQTQLHTAQARANLSTLRANLLTNASDKTVTQEYSNVRSQLQTAYGNAGGAAADTWTKIKPQLDKLKGQITSSRQKAASTVQSILNDLPQR